MELEMEYIYLLDVALNVREKPQRLTFLDSELRLKAQEELHKLGYVTSDVDMLVQSSVDAAVQSIQGSLGFPNSK
jgi:hypothetical protein